jgi:hypothetical protein
MKTDSFHRLALAAALACVVTSTSLQATLVLNGSFENETGLPLGQFEAGSGLCYIAPDTAVDNWTVINTHNFYLRPTTVFNGDYSIVPKDGASYVSLYANNDGLGAIYQPISLTAGVKYTVSFWEVNRSSQGGVTGIDAAFFSDTALSTAVSDVAWANNSNYGVWQQTTFDYTPATSGTAYLGFRTHSGAPWGSNLDNVSVTFSAIPEPGSVLALGCLLGSGIVLRRRIR